jgi:hypothetical protein
MLFALLIVMVMNKTLAIADGARFLRMHDTRLIRGCGVAHAEAGSFAIKDKRDNYREAGMTGGPRRVENPLSTESQEE